MIESRLVARRISLMDSRQRTEEIEMQIQERVENERGATEPQVYVEPSQSLELTRDYHQVDSLAQLKANVAKLAELHFKLHFMVGEIAHLTSKK